MILRQIWTIETGSFGLTFLILFSLQDMDLKHVHNTRQREIKLQLK